MQTIKLIIAFILTLPLIASGQKTTDYELILEGGTYEVGNSRLNFALSVQNNSTDTLVMVLPNFTHFKEHYSFQPVQTIGEISKPYSLELIVKQECEEVAEVMAPVQDYPKMVYMHQVNMLVIPPGEQSRKYFIFVNLPGFEFCEEGIYEARVTYEPDYDTLTAKQLAFLQKKKKEFDVLASKAGNYIEKENLSPDSFSNGGTILHLALDNEKHIKSLTPVKLTSSTIALSQK